MYDDTHNDRKDITTPGITTPDITAPDITGLAEGFLEAQGAGGFVEAPSATHGLALEDAYRVGAGIARARLRSGWRPAGWKVGLTNREIWLRWGLDRPIIAPVYRETVFRVPSQPGGAAWPHRSVPMGTRASARLEVEVVFGFSDALDAETAAGPRIPPIWIALGVELVDCHYRGWRFSPADGVADFGLHAGLIVGPPVDLPPRRDPPHGDPPPDFSRSLPEMAVSLLADGEVLARGRGDAVLGSPFHVLAELHDSLGPAIAAYPATPGPAPPGDSREAGRDYIVSTGTLTPLVEARIGTTYKVEADLLPSFSFVLV